MAKGRYHEWLEPDGILRLEAWARDGLTDEQIAHDKIGISRTTLYEWKNRFPDIENALKKNKEIADIEVENALRKRALGYDWEEVRTEIISSGTVKGGKFVEASKAQKKTTKTTRHVPGDVTAQIFYLKNRQPGIWRSKPPEDVDIEDSDAYFEAAEMEGKE